jgi:hypothetical protein
MEGFTVAEMAEILGIAPNAVAQRLFVARIKPVTKDALYDKAALEKIRNVPGKGTPMKHIKLFLGNPTEEKVNLFLNSAKTVLKNFINAKNKFPIGFSLSSSVKSPNKPTTVANNEYTEIAKLVMELFIKQEEDNPLPLAEVLQLLKKAASIGKDEELLQLINEAEKIHDVAPVGRPPKAKTETKPASKGRKAKPKT